jgi:hypothetical protein
MVPIVRVVQKRFLTKINDVRNITVAFPSCFELSEVILTPEIIMATVVRTCMHGPRSSQPQSSRPFARDAMAASWPTSCHRERFNPCTLGRMTLLDGIAFRDLSFSSQLSASVRQPIEGISGAFQGGAFGRDFVFGCILQ